MNGVICEHLHYKLTIFPALVLALSISIGCAERVIIDNPDTPWAETVFSLVPAESCASVKQRVIDATTEEIIQYRYGGGYWMEDANGVPTSAPTRGGDEPTDYTTTNVQEEGVDETDILKTDGNFLYTVNNGQFIILKSWPVTELSELARVDLADGSQQGYGYNYSPGLFLYGDRVAVFSNVYEETGEATRPDEKPDLEVRPFYGTRITLIDVTNRTDPKVERRIDLEGSYADARLIGAELYLVTNAGLFLPFNIWEYTWREDIPDVPNAEWNTDEARRDALRDEARPVIRALIASDLTNTQIEDLLPRMRTDLNPTTPMLGCTDLYIPRTTSQLGTLTITHLSLDSASGATDNVGLLARGWEVYASLDNLYIAMSSRGWWWGWGPQDNETHIHKFALDYPTSDNNAPQYVASGRVDGWLLNQFSMSEHQNFLRIATTDNEWTWNQTTEESEVVGGNHLTILEQAQGLLSTTGSVRNLAPGEQIFSARMLGTRGYLVTFRQTDPLFTFDLSDPYAPKLMGELKINGFSSYMHPLGDTHLLTIGQDADDDGRVTGLHFQIFDVSDLANPTRTFQELISTGSWSSWSEAMWDHHAFTYHPGKEILAVPANIYDWEHEGQRENFSGLLIYKASAKEGFSEIGRVSHTHLVSQSWCKERERDWSCEPDQDYTWWTNMRRSVFIEDNVFGLSDIGITVNDLYTPTLQYGAVVF